MSTWPFGIIGEIIGHAIGHAIGHISFDIYRSTFDAPAEGPCSSDWFSPESGQNDKCPMIYDQ